MRLTSPVIRSFLIHVIGFTSFIYPFPLKCCHSHSKYIRRHLPKYPLPLRYISKSFSDYLNTYLGGWLPISPCSFESSGVKTKLDTGNFNAAQQQIFFRHHIIYSFIYSRVSPTHSCGSLPHSSI